MKGRKFNMYMIFIGIILPLFIYMLFYIFIFRKDIKWCQSSTKILKIIFLISIAIIIYITQGNLYIFWAIILPGIFGYYGIKNLKITNTASRSTGLILIVFSFFLYLPLIFDIINYFFSPGVAEQIKEFLTFTVVTPLFFGGILFIPIVVLYSLIQIIRK